jgi:hypothetical protein
MQASALLVALAILGCTTTEVRPVVEPEACQPAELGELPEIDAGELYDRVGPELYKKLLQREKTIVDWGLENEAVLESICAQPQRGTEDGR